MVNYIVKMTSLVISNDGYTIIIIFIAFGVKIINEMKMINTHQLHILKMVKLKKWYGVMIIGKNIV
jgi:hypothetical protein